MFHVNQMGSQSKDDSMKSHPCAPAGAKILHIETQSPVNTCVSMYIMSKPWKNAVICFTWGTGLQEQRTIYSFKAFTGTYQQYSSYFVAVVWTHLSRALLAPPWNERRGLRLTGGLLVSVLLELSTDELLLDWGCRAGRWLVNSSIWTRR